MAISRKYTKFVYSVQKSPFGHFSSLQNFPHHKCMSLIVLKIWQTTWSQNNDTVFLTVCASNRDVTSVHHLHSSKIQGHLQKQAETTHGLQKNNFVKGLTCTLIQFGKLQFKLKKVSSTYGARDTNELLFLLPIWKCCAS